MSQGSLLFSLFCPFIMVIEKEITFHYFFKKITMHTVLVGFYSVVVGDETGKRNSSKDRLCGHIDDDDSVAPSYLVHVLLRFIDDFLFISIHFREGHSRPS